MILVQGERLYKLGGFSIYLNFGIYSILSECKLTADAYEQHEIYP